MAKQQECDHTNVEQLTNTGKTEDGVTMFLCPACGSAIYLIKQADGSFKPPQSLQDIEDAKK